MTGYALTNVQLGFWGIWRRFPDRPINHRSMVLEWRMPLDVDRFAEAIGDLVAETDALRLRFSETRGRPLQSAVEKDEIELGFRDFRDDPDARRTASAWLESLTAVPFDLERQVFRSTLARIGDEHWLWLCDQHHVITDYSSGRLIVSRLAEAYRARCDGTAQRREHPSFLDHIARHGAARAIVAFNGPQPPRLCLSLPATGPGHGLAQKRLLTSETPLEAGALGPSMDDGERRSAGELYDAFLAASALFIHRLSGEVRIPLGVLFHGRLTPESRGIIGPFLQNLPLTVEVDPSWTCDELLSKVSEARKAVYRAARDGEDITGPPPIAIVNFLPEAMPDFAGVPSYEVRENGVEEWVGADLNLRLEAAAGGGYRLRFSLAEPIAEALGIDAMTGAFQRVLAAVAARSPARVDAVAMTGPEAVEAERARAAAALAAPPPDYGSVPEAFLRHAERQPAAIAVRDGEHELSYAELEEQSRLIAQGLAAEGLAGDEVVGLRLPLSRGLVAAELGIWRAGGTRLALDRSHPAERHRIMLKDAGARLLIVPDGDGESGLPEGVRGLTIRGLMDAGRAHGGDLPGAAPDGAMYIIYTSGTTGTPKGSVVPHGAFARADLWARSIIDPDGPIHAPMATSLAFDAVLRGYCGLTSGGRIVTYSDPDGSVGASVLRMLREDAVHCMGVTPSQLRSLVSRRWHPARLRAILLSGEPVPVELARSAHEAFGPEVALYNLFGISETVMALAAHRFDPKADRGTLLPGGVLDQSTTVHILDGGGAPVPKGVAGEIHIGGVRLSRGYLNRPELNARAYIDDPFRAGGRLYRSGDLGSLDAEGRLHTHGRRDDQIKINGQRVELSEVEAAVMRHPGIDRCAAILVKEPDQRLGVFYQAEVEIEPAELRRIAGETLPRALVPRHFVRVDALPFTATGKTDRLALAARLAKLSSEDASPRGTTPPDGPRETALAMAWQKMLGCASVAREDSFFDLGGDSLAFVQMVLLLEREFDCSVPLDRISGETSLADAAAALPAPKAAAGAVRSRPNLVRRAVRRIRRMMTPKAQAPPDDQYWPRLRRRLMLAARDWPGTQVGRAVPVSALNEAGTRAPFFWCFNGAAEPRALAEALGPDQPFYALRSFEGILEASHKIGMLTHLVEDYVSEIERLLGDRPLMIGGNCQSGGIAEEVLKGRLAEGRPVSRLLALDYTPQSPHDLDVNLFYGRDSTRFNPFLTQSHPERDWENRFSTVTWDILPGDHGTYFSANVLPVFAERLAARLADQNRGDPTDRR